MSDTGSGSDQRYIRTFAGDIAVTQKGGKPDLAPIAEHDKLLTAEQAAAPAAQPESVAAGPAPLAPPTAPLPTAPIPPEVPQVSVSAPTPPQAVPVSGVENTSSKPFEWNEQMRAAALVRLHAQMAQDKARGVQRSTEISRPIGISSDEVEAEVETVRADPLRTYSSDFTDQVKAKGASAMTILAAEQDAGRAASPVSPKVKKTLYIGIGGVLVLVGAVGAYIGYTQYQAAHAPVMVAPSIAAPVFFEEKEEITEKGAPIVAAIVASAGKTLSPNTVRLLYSNDATTTQETLFVAARFAAPNIVRRNIVGNGASMAGIVNANGSTAPFFILGVASYNETFAGMLSWEKTMSKDLVAVFPPYPAPVVSTTTATSTATTTPKKPSPAPAKPTTKATTTTASTTPRVTMTAGFRDEVIANHDVRVYRDDQGRTLFLYGYWSQTVLVIARDAAAFTELADRLAGARSQP